MLLDMSCLQILTLIPLIILFYLVFKRANG